MSDVTTAAATSIQWDDESREKVEQVWGGIMHVAELVVKRHDALGFEVISKRITPTLADILRSLRLVECMLDTLTPLLRDDYSLYRMVLNAKQQINHIESASIAVEAGNPADYHKAMDALKSQAVF